MHNLYTNIMYKISEQYMQNCRRKASDKVVSTDRWTDGQPWRFQYTPSTSLWGYNEEIAIPKNHVSSGVYFNLIQNKPWFLHVCSTSVLKTLWEKEKLFVMSNFCFPHSVFYQFKEFLPFSSNLKLSSSNSFSLEES